MSFKLKSGRKSAKSALPAARNFTSDRRGNIATMFGLAMIPAFMMVGAGIDYANAYRAKQTLQNAVDSAVLAAISATGKTDAERQVIGEQTFAANVAGTPVTAGATANVVVNGSTATASSSLAVPTSFLKMAHLNSIGVNAGATASSSGKSLEVAMMIDLTGSMGGTVNGTKKIDSLKEAGADLLNILFPGGATTSSTVRIGVVPFADYVNAGDFAATATGLPSTGGSYNKYDNLSQTKQSRSFGGQYSGSSSSSTQGSQFGATAPTNLPAGATNVAGATYQNAYCGTGPNTGGTGTGSVMQISYNGTNYPAGERVSSDWNGDAPDGLVKATSNSKVRDFKEWDRGWKWDSGVDSSGYFVPIPADVTGLVTKKSYGYDIGDKVSIDNGQPNVPQIKYGWYRKIDKIRSNGTLDLEWEYGYYFPVYENLNTSGNSGSQECTTAMDQPSGKLITCVTDRKKSDGSVDYSDDAPSALSYVGAFNQGNTSKSNYSDDGKCFTAGRELPAVIPLTNSKDTLSSFFTNATVGGATPGHLGTAWAWYLLSPNWANVFPNESAPVAYNQATTEKVAILMTDGEYNVHYASPSAVTQAKAYCDGMKAKNITVYTIGFGFASGTVANANGTASERAREVLEYCATGSNHYYFPYDGTALRQAFSNIGNALMTGQKQLRVTN